MRELDEIVADFEKFGLLTAEGKAALIADWRWRGELLKAERLHIIELEVENAELVAVRAELARLRSAIAALKGNGEVK